MHVSLALKYICQCLSLVVRLAKTSEFLNFIEECIQKTGIQRSRIFLWVSYYTNHEVSLTLCGEPAEFGETQSTRNLSLD